MATLPPPDDPTPRRRTGGRVAGTAYAPPAPAVAGKCGRFPYRDYSDVQPPALRDTYEWWQDICLDIREQRFALRQEQEDVAREAGITLNTYQRMERGQWVAVHNLFLACSVLGLRIDQAVPVRREPTREPQPSRHLRSQES